MKSHTLTASNNHHKGYRAGPLQRGHIISKEFRCSFMYLHKQVWHYAKQQAHRSRNLLYKHGTDTVCWPLFSSNSNDTGIFVSDIIRGGVADSDGRLLLGDQILSINEEDVRAASQEHAQTLLQVRLKTYMSIKELVVSRSLQFHGFIV